MATLCAKCGAKQPMLMQYQYDEATKSLYCPTCATEIVAAAAKEKSDTLARLTALADGVIVTTTAHIDGHRVARYLGIESVEFVIGTGLFSEITTDFQDFFGQRSGAFESKLQQAKAAALQTLRMRAAQRGANAVLAIDLDYTEFSGNRIGLIVNGTLVEVVPVQQPGTSGGA